MVARETSLSRAEAEEAVRELRVRALEFEESLTRRQDDAQQEFLVLHNQAVAHAERITQDANDQVAASLEHAQRVSAKADDFDRLMRAQAQQIEADANVRAREQLDRARIKAQKIIDTVTTHSQTVLRDAEDRTRQLRWQQHQLMSFMAEVKELIRPEMTLDGAALSCARRSRRARRPRGGRRRPRTAEAGRPEARTSSEDEGVEHVEHSEPWSAASTSSSTAPREGAEDGQSAEAAATPKTEHEPTPVDSERGRPEHRLRAGRSAQSRRGLAGDRRDERVDVVSRRCRSCTSSAPRSSRHPSRRSGTTRAAGRRPRRARSRRRRSPASAA